jgi:hypothetical protein
MPVHQRRRSSFVCSLIALCSLAVATSYAVSGAGFTTVNEAADGPDHCQNGNPQVNCNIYDGKQFVWLNGGPAANGLGPDGQYFFAVLEPGGQPNPNDDGAKNLSDDFDTYMDRTFTVAGGEVYAYAGTTHTSDLPLIRLAPYADTTNTGGVYIMAICSLARDYPVNPRDCKYDAFKVREAEVARVQAHLSGMKYEDSIENGKFDDPGEPGLPEWAIVISCEDGSGETVTATVYTGGNGMWEYATPLHVPTGGTTTCTVKEVQQPENGWSQTGNTEGQYTHSEGASVELMQVDHEKFYVVTVPNDAVSTVGGLHFGNRKQPPSDN